MSGDNSADSAHERMRHWDQVYATKPADTVSWYQREPVVSLDLIDGLGPSMDTAVLDIGGGASVLVDRLLARGFKDISVLDIAAPALALGRGRLGAEASRVNWHVADVTTWRPDERRYGLWHDRAVFHFMTTPEARNGYLSALDRGLAAGGYLIIATFAPTGPERCSGLEVVRYAPETLQATLGDSYRLLEVRHEAHVTPAGGRQDFTWCLFRKGLGAMARRTA